MVTNPPFSAYTEMKKIKSTATYIITEEKPEEEILIHYDERDEEENLLVEEKYFPDGTPESRIVRTYGEQGRLKLEKEYSADSEVPHQETEYSYSAAGRVTETVIRYQDGSVSYRRYSHDEANNSETIDIVDEEGENEGKEYRRYDSEGRVLEEVIHDEEGALEQSVTNEYDEHGQLLKRVSLFPDDYEVIELYFYERDEKSQIIERTVENEEEEVLRHDEFDYDERGNNTEHRVQNYSQGWAVTDRLVYDEKDRVVKNQRLLPNGAIIRETDFAYNENDLLAEQENRTQEGVHLLVFKYEFF